VKILVTGADGFVGSWLVPRLVRDGHTVVAAVHPDRPLFAERTTPPWPPSVEAIPFDLLDGEVLRRALTVPLDAVVHLAAVASGGDARRDPELAWQINATGTARLAAELARRRDTHGSDPLLLLVSTAEVYGAGDGEPRRETDPTEPCSHYAESKLAGETAALDEGRRTGLRVVVARPFPHTGKGQDTRFVVPAFAQRIVEAKREGRSQISVGNLDPVREFLHVSDVVEAYVRLLEVGEPGEAYNVAGGEAIALAELFDRLAHIAGHPAEPVTDPKLVRPVDIPHLVGDPTKLIASTDWRPTVALDEILTEVVDAQTH
jgi:GDP-4-dehydro-6-deoxy-D-mannose reductase